VRTPLDVPNFRVDMTGVVAPSPRPLRVLDANLPAITVEGTATAAREPEAIP
jgi:hypothetical protein